MAWLSCLSSRPLGQRWPAALLLALWTTAGLAGSKSAADYYVRDLPGVPKDSAPIKMHAGYVTPAAPD